MTSEQARARFDAALDGELSESERQLFDAALAHDATLAAEYAELQRVVQATRSLGSAREETSSVDILSGVQQRLRERSGGRFYRDRFSEARGQSAEVTWVITLSLILVLAAALWFGFDAGLFGAPRLSP